MLDFTVNSHLDNMKTKHVKQLTFDSTCRIMASSKHVDTFSIL